MIDKEKKIVQRIIQMMANYLLRKNDIEKAIQQYKDIIERNPSKLKLL